MSLTAAKLSENAVRDKGIDAFIREQLQIIDGKLHGAAASWGWNVVSHDISNNLLFPGISKKDAQRAVYHGIILSLTQRGFTPRLLLYPSPEGDVATVYVGWTVKVSDGEIEQMNSVIRKHRLGREDLDSFIRNGPGIPPTPQGGVYPTVAPAPGSDKPPPE